MTVAKRLALIAAGYALAIPGGVAAVAINELRIPADIKETSGGMVAFGDMILFVLATGFLSLVPTWFLLKLFAEKAPRTLLAILLVVAALGPASWLAMVYISRGLPNSPAAIGELFGLFIAFVAVPRIVFGPVLLVIEAVTFFLVRGRILRALVVAAMLMDLIPIGMYALFFARTFHR